jgi:hypothetical protein
MSESEQVVSGYTPAQKAGFYAHILAALLLVAAPAWAIHPAIGFIVLFAALGSIEIAHGMFDDLLGPPTPSGE